MHALNALQPLRPKRSVRLFPVFSRSTVRAENASVAPDPLPAAPFRDTPDAAVSAAGAAAFRFPVRTLSGAFRSAAAGSSGMRGRSDPSPDFSPDRGRACCGPPPSGREAEFRARASFTVVWPVLPLPRRIRIRSVRDCRSGGSPLWSPPTICALRGCRRSFRRSPSRSSCRAY